MSLTPVLRWDTVPGANYIYTVKVSEGFQLDLFGRRVFETLFGTVQPNSSFVQIPAGLLKPATTYSWNVEAVIIGDRSDLGTMTSCYFMAEQRFTTVGE